MQIMKSQPTVKVILDTRYNKKFAATFPAKLRVTFQKKQVLYKTGFLFTEKTWAKMHGGRPDQLKNTLIELQEIEAKAKRIIDKLSVFSFDQFDKKYLNYTGTTTIAGAFTQFSIDLRAAGQIGNAINYECAAKSLSKFRPEALLADVNITFLNEYEAWMKERNRSTTTVSMYVRSLRCVINKAIVDGEFQKEAYPFGRHRFEIPESRNIKKALKEAEISSIVNYPCTGAMEKARDFWYFIYLCGGINVQDVCLLKYSDIKRNKIEYERSKTARTKKKKSKIVVLITDDVRHIIEKYGQGGTGYIFPIMETEATPERRKQLVQYFTHWINDYVKAIAKDLKIDMAVTTYVARHSYASQLLRSGVSISAISKKMHDGNIKTTMNYLSDLTDEQEIEMANALTSFKKPQAKIVNLAS